MRLTKTDMARVVVQALLALPELPAADHPQVISRARRTASAALTRQHALACAALASAAPFVLAPQYVQPGRQRRMLARMDAPAYRAQLARLGLTQEGGARILGVDGRTSRRWALGERPIPDTVARLLWACGRFPGLLEALRDDYEPTGTEKPAHAEGTQDG